MIASLANGIGLVGVALVLLAYFMLQINKISSANIWYSVMNCLGSAMILFSLFFAWNLSAALVEGAWVAISAIGVWKGLSSRYFHKRKTDSKSSSADREFLVQEANQVEQPT